MPDDITVQIYKILLNNSQDKTIEINDDTLLESLGLDSIGVVEIVYDIEELFDIEIPNPGQSETINTDFKSAGDVIAAVKQLLAATS